MRHWCGKDFEFFDCFKFLSVFAAVLLWTLETFFLNYNGANLLEQNFCFSRIKLDTSILMHPQLFAPLSKAYCSILTGRYEAIHKRHLRQGKGGGLVNKEEFKHRSSLKQSELPGPRKSICIRTFAFCLDVHSFLIRIKSVVAEI